MSSGERLRNRLIVATLGAAVGLLIVAYPRLLDSGISQLGVRPLALGLIALGALLALVTRSFRHRVLSAGALAVPALLAPAAVTGNPVFLQLVPSAIYVVAAGVLAASLRQPMSLMERAVRTLIPNAPTFIADYCRGLTRFWAWFFAVAAAITAALALAGPLEWWRQFTSWGVFAAMIGVGVAEFPIRKTRFRYYYVGGPIDRAWSHFFPAEETALGRQSLEYIRHRREQIRREQEAEAARLGGQRDRGNPSL